KAIEMLIFHHGTESLLESESDQESAETDLFDEFEYEEEKVDKRDGYYTSDVLSDEELYENPWKEMESPAIYLTNVEEIPTLEGEKEPELTSKKQIESLIEKNTELGEEDKETQPEMVQVVTQPLGDQMNVQGQMHSIYRHLRWLQRTQQRIQSLVYAYYLGMLLTQQERVSFVSKHYYVTSTRIYALFSGYGVAQIYRTTYLNLNVIRQLKKEEFRRLVIG
ncbi:1322_t:CDS:2, partial [Acaulospora morrowiae]